MYQKYLIKSIRVNTQPQLSGNWRDTTLQLDVTSLRPTTSDLMQADVIYRREDGTEDVIEVQIKVDCDVAHYDDNELECLGEPEDTISNAFVRWQDDTEMLNVGLYLSDKNLFDTFLTYGGIQRCDANPFIAVASLFVCL